MPVADILSFSYGDYTFDPRPLVTISKEYIKTPANTGVATKYSLTLNGTVIPDTGRMVSSQNFAGINVLFNRSDTISGMRQAFERDYNLLFLGCPSLPPIISGYPKIVSIEFSPKGDNYVQQAEYSINLELPQLVGTGFEPVGASGGAGDVSAYGLVSVSDEFTIEFLDERAGGSVDIAGFGKIPSVFSVQRSLSAQGETMGTGQGGAPVEAWRNAKNWITSQISDERNQGFPPEATGISGLMCLGTGLNYLNQFRSVSVSTTEGTCNATCSFIAASGTAYEDLEVSVDRSHDNPFTTISINGALNGIANLSGIYNGCTSEVPEAETIKFNNALSGWNDVSGLVYSRAQAVYNNLPPSKGRPDGVLNTGALTESLGYNIIAGTVTYNYTYDDRPYNCYPPALIETINIIENNPNDIFASLTVIGRAPGPLLQQISTSGVTTRDLSIDAIIPVVTGCIGPTDPTDFLEAPTAYNAFLEGYRTMLDNKYDQVFVNSQNKTWEPKVGHFTANVSYTVGKC